MTTGSVVVCTWGEEIGEIEDVLTLAGAVSTAWKTHLEWLVLGPAPDDRTAMVAGQYRVVAIDCMGDPRLNAFQPDLYVGALAEYCARRSPMTVLFRQTDDSRLVVARLAGRLNCGVVMNVVDLEVGAPPQLRVTATAYGGATHAVYEVRGAPALLAVSANAAKPAPLATPAARPAINEISLDLGELEERITVETPAQRQSGPRLEDAQIVVAGGRGLGDAKNFRLVRELATALHGMAGASRPIVDSGWIDSSHQVGLTGKITKPALYIAVGISGASQHMIGCAAAKTIVAINRDPDAAVFRYARYGIVADCLELLPALIRAANGRDPSTVAPGRGNGQPAEAGRTPSPGERSSDSLTACDGPGEKP